MKPTRKKYTRHVTALVDADPTFVSLVSSGANGSPFNVVKQENPTMGVKIKKRTAPITPVQKQQAKGATAVRKNANNRVAKGKEALSETRAAAESSVISKFLYSKEEFADEAAVRAHIEKSDFEGEVVITEEDDHFVATDESVDAARIAKSVEVEADTGVTAVIVSLSDDSEEEEDDSEEDEDGEGDDSEEDEAEEEEEGEEEDEAEEEDEQPVQKSAPKKPAAKTTETPAPAAPVKTKKALFLEEAAAEVEEEAAEPVEATLQKFNFWDVYDSKSSDFATLLKDGCSDGLAPSFEDLLWTFGRSVMTALAGDSDPSGTIKKNADDFTRVAVAQHELFANIVNADMGVVEKADKEKAAGLTKWAKAFAKELVAKDERKPAAAVAVIKNEAGIPADALAAAVAAAIAPVTEQLSSVAKTVDKLGARRQVSKGIDPADATTSEGQAPAATQKTEKKTNQKAIDAANRIGQTVFAAAPR